MKKFDTHILSWQSAKNLMAVLECVSDWDFVNRSHSIIWI